MPERVSLILTAVFTAVSAVICLTRQFHMLQLNSYFASRYLGWVRTAFSYRVVFAALSFALSAVLLATGAAGYVPLAVWALFSGFLRAVFALSGNKRAVKKLVVTARVGRMYLTAGLAALIVPLMPALGAKPEIPLFVLFVLQAAAPVTALAVLFVNKPFEKAIAKFYVADAARILKKCPELTVIGITGSYGKTGTKFILSRILSEKYEVCMTPESYNTLLGVVRTVREHLQPGAQVFVVEMGAKNIGDIREICDLVHPTLGIVTSVGPQHLSTFKTVENVAKTKFELADAVQRNGGKVYLNADNPFILERGFSYDRVYYGIRSDKAACRAENISVTPRGLKFDAVYGERRIPLETKLLGSHNVLNILAAVTVACDLGLDDVQIRHAVARLTPVPHRLELKPFFKGSVLIDDSYNANPEGCLEAVRVLGSFEGRRKIVVTPGLVELGEAEFEHNKRLGEEIARRCDFAILVGKKRAVPIHEGLKAQNFPEEKILIAESFKEALAWLQQNVNENDAVLFENDLPDNYAG